MNHGRHPKPEHIRAREENVRWLASWGEPLHEVARRVGMKPDSLQRWLHRNDRDTLRRLVRNSEDRGLTINGKMLEPQR